MKFFVYHNEVYATVDPYKEVMYHLADGGLDHPCYWIWQVIPHGLGMNIWEAYLKETNSGKSA